jgi:hypothetical protein
MLSAAAIAALQRGNKIEAIKIVRTERGCDLKDAKDAVDAYVESNPALKSSLEAQSVAAGGTLLKWLAGLAILGALFYFGYRR